jgi:hypothetical protein
MRRIVLTLAVALSASAFAIKAEAMPLGHAIGDAADALNVVEQSQFIYGGRNYCWYPNGWRGPGFYWCGYHLRRGLGWGGPVGWRGWHHGPRVVGPRIHGPRIHGPRIHAGPRMHGGRQGGQGRRRH